MISIVSVGISEYLVIFSYEQMYLFAIFLIYLCGCDDSHSVYNINKNIIRKSEFITCEVDSVKSETVA